MKYLSVLLATIVFATAGAPSWAQPGHVPEKPVRRAPFMLRLQLTNGEHYEERITRRVPYVYNNAAYLFAGEAFGLRVRLAHGKIAGIAYRKQTTGADVELGFRQFKTKSGLAIMMLKIKNNLHKKLYVTAVITHPGDTNRYQTNIRPIAPGQAGYETWAQPIIELKLANLRFSPQLNY